MIKFCYSDFLKLILIKKKTEQWTINYNNKNNANNNNNQNKETNKSIHNIKRKKCEFDVRTQTKPQTQPGKYTNTKLQSIATDMAQERCVIHLQ